MVGSRTDVKGGMTTVVESFLQYNFGNDINFKFIPTHIEGNSFKKSFFFSMSIIRLCYQLFFRDIDIVHMHMSERGSFNRKYMVFKISKYLNKKVITHMHGAEFKEFFQSSNRKKQCKIRDLLKKSDKVITLGQNWDNIIKEIEPCTNTLILRNAIKIPKNRNKLNQKKMNVLFLGVLIQRKGIIDLIEASKEIINKLDFQGKQIKFLIAGDGELRQFAEKLVIDLGIENYYEFLGWVNNEEKQELLKNTDIFILPSYNEGLPMSILEAISYGIPVIATNVGSINEAVFHNENGLLIEPGNIEQLSNSVLSIISDFDQNFEIMGSKSRELAEGLFDIKIYFQEIKRMYTTL